MALTTVYDIALRYRLEDRATKQMRAMAQSASGVSRAFSGIATAAAGYFTGRAAYNALIKYNAGVEETKNQIAGMFALTKKTNLSDELANADKMFANLQKRANVLPGTTQEYAQFAAMVTRSVTDAGLGMKDLENITVSAVSAAKAFGEQTDVAARDIDQLLGGRFNTTDPFSKKLLGSMGFDSEEGREKVRAMSKAQRADLLKRALAQKQIQQLMAAQGQTMEGRLSTLQDTIQQTLGRAGSGLFKTLGKEIEAANKWFEANQGKVIEWANKVSDALVTGFGYLKDAIKFIVDHSDTLLSIAKAYAVFKVGSFAKGMIGGAAGSGMGFLGRFVTNKNLNGELDRDAGGRWMPNRTRMIGASFKDKSMGVGDRLSMLSSSLIAGLAIGTAIDQKWKLSERIADGLFRTFHKAEAEMEDAYNALTRLSEQMDKNKLEAEKSLDARVKKAEDDLRMAQAGGDASAVARAEYMARFARVATMAPAAQQEHAILNAITNNAANPSAAGMSRIQQLTSERTALISGTMNTVDAGLAKMTEEQRRSVDIEDLQLRVMEVLFRQMVARKGGALGPDMATEDIVANIIKNTSGKNAAKGTQVDVKINRIEVKSDDPDRFVFGMNTAFEKAGKNPAGASSAFRRLS